MVGDLNYTFSPECVAKESFEFFCGGFLATEIMSARRCEQLYSGLRRAGVPQEALTYLSLHAKGDIKHSEQVCMELIEPTLRAGGSAREMERGLKDRLERSERYLRWYESHVA